MMFIWWHIKFSLSQNNLKISFKFFLFFTGVEDGTSVSITLGVHSNIEVKYNNKYYRKNDVINADMDKFDTLQVIQEVPWYICLFGLSLFQTTNFRPFKTEKGCRRQIQIWLKWQKVLQTGRKNCGKTRNCSFLLFPHCFQKTGMADT